MRNRQILLVALAVVAILLVIGIGIVLGNQLGTQGKAATPATAAPDAAALAANLAAVTQPTATPAAPAAAVKSAANPPAQRVAVPGGLNESNTGIAILPSVTLHGDRRYVLQVSSQAGALPFSGSYSRGSIDPKIAIDAMQQIAGTTPWEQEIQPPAPDTRTWSLGASISLQALGKPVRLQVWDIGPK